MGHYGMSRILDVDRPQTLDGELGGPLAEQRYQGEAGEAKDWKSDGYNTWC